MTRAYQQGTSVYVIGTGEVQAALPVAGISPDTHRWGSTSYGLFARRQGRWRQVSSDHPPKDARPGVCFVGPIEPRPPATHVPCCSSHGVAMTCERYRRTHFVEVRPCCSLDADRLRLESALVVMVPQESGGAR